jgi:hypothetical protein
MDVALPSSVHDRTRLDWMRSSFGCGTGRVARTIWMFDFVGIYINYPNYVILSYISLFTRILLLPLDFAF